MPEATFNTDVETVPPLIHRWLLLVSVPPLMLRVLTVLAVLSPILHSLLQVTTAPLWTFTSDRQVENLSRVTVAPDPKVSLAGATP